LNRIRRIWRPAISSVGQVTRARRAGDGPAQIVSIIHGNPFVLV